MILTLVRRTSTRRDTLGLLFLDGRFLCYTLEDEYRTQKVYGETRIPAGTYRLALRREGRLFHKYSKRFHENHPMLWLQDVPGFRWIYIHIGNTERDTEGCILVGKGYRLEGDRYVLVQSTIAYKQIYYPIRDAVELSEVGGEPVWITIADADLVA